MQYPYIPNSNEAVRKEMLDFIGAKSVEEIYSFIPDEVRMKKPLDIPAPFTTEQELSKHMNSILAEDSTCEENISFLGAGCYDHYVPAICDEINGRSEFLTAYSGDTYADHGKCQAFFEFSSMMGELLDLDVISFPTYDGGQAASTALMMSRRINGRSKALVPENMNPNLLSQMTCYCEGMQLIGVKAKENGQMDLEDLKAKLDSDVAAVFIQNPCFLGFFEEQGKEIGELAHSVGAEYVVYADPSSLGITEPPADYGADISCGEIQPLGIHMNYGGGQSGFMATMDDPTYVLEFPSRLFGICRTNTEGEYAFADVAYDRTSFGHLRDKAKEYVGTQTALWGITAGVYLATMGPQGMQEVGETIMQNAQYAAQKLAALPNVSLRFSAPFFKEFVLDFSKTGKTVAEINKALLEKHIFGGKDLSRDFPALGQCAMYCVTEVHTKEDIDTLVSALSEIL